MRVRLPVLLSMLVAVVAFGCGGSDGEGINSAAGQAATSASAVGASATAPALTGNLNVFAAASLTDAFNEIAAELQKANPGLKITFNFAASTALRTQIEQGAKADVYASADQVQMESAKKAGVIDGQDQVFVKNKLVVIYPSGNPGKIASIQDLAKPGLKLVLTDKNVPIGAYARTALEKMSADAQFGADFEQKVLANLRSEEANVRAVVTKVQLGEADAGIVYASDVTPAISKDVTAILIPDQFNTIASYPIAVVKDGGNKTAAQGLIAFVRSVKGQEILKKWNFIVDKDTGMARAVSGTTSGSTRVANSLTPPVWRKLQQPLNCHAERSEASSRAA
jgi:molybdate transport system substrate-binding protein